MPNKPVNILDQVARDMTRTYLHGARNNGTAMTVATGQQIEVAPPTGGDDMLFQFQLDGGQAYPVKVKNAPALQADGDMQAALASAAKYLTLNVDPDIPTWACSSRPFSLPSAPAAQDVVNVTIARAAATAVVLPSPVVEEVDDSVGSFVSLFQQTTTGPQPVPAADWQPGIVVRFPLKASSSTDAIFELSGTPQGDRYFLDQLKLLPGQAPGPAVAGIALTLETVIKDSDPKHVPVTSWTIARSNLTAQPRSQAFAVRSEAVALNPATYPYVAVSDDASDPKGLDAIRLLQMASIVNSGGYFLRAETAMGGVPPTNLILTVSLAPSLDPTPVTDPLFDRESAYLPVAANAILYSPVPTPSYPNVIRFNGAQHLQIKPAAKPGCVLAGWTRVETNPDNYAHGVDQFGFGSLSIVEYSAASMAAGDNFCSFDQSMPLSATDAPSGQTLPPAPTASALDAASVATPPHHTGDASLLRLRHRKDAVAIAALTPRAETLADPTQVTRYFRASIQCYPDNGNPWARLTDANRSLINITPGLRTLYGSRVPLPPPQAPAVSPVFQRRLFYTDALLQPGEWPGVRFAVYPSGAPGNASITLEIAYHALQINHDNADSTLPENLDITLPDATARLQQLDALRVQLTGAGDGDVSVTLDAAPLCASVKLVVQDLITAVGSWMALETNNANIAGSGPRPDAPVIRYSYPVVDTPGAFGDCIRFLPTLTVQRMTQARWPQTNELPAGSLGTAIQTEIVTASSQLSLQPAATQPAPNPPLPPDPNAPALPAFLAVAQAFQKVIINAQVAYLRDPANLHELWLVPNTLFPTANTDPAAQWGYATPRPLNNQLGFETFDAPDFTTLCSPNPKGCWTDGIGTINYLLNAVTLAEQDYDVLGRAAFRFLEQQTADVTLLTDPANAGSMRLLLAAREQIADTLSQFGDGQWLVPLYGGTSANLDGPAIQRVARDAFRQNLSSFYSLSTIVQLPLTKPQNDKTIQLFEGYVTPVFVATAAGSVVPPLPVFSDVIIGRGKGALETMATVLYDLPGSAKQDGVQAISSLQISFTHVQIPVDANFPGPPDFNQGRWLRLAQPYALVAWKAPVLPPVTTGGSNPAFHVPVADRVFPAKPILQSTLPLQAAVGPASLTKDTTPLLTAWGWQVTLGLVEPDAGDNVQVDIFYTPMSTAGSFASALAAPQAWAPATLLESLYTLTALQTNWAAIAKIPPAPAPSAALSPLTALVPLASSLSGFLGRGPLSPSRAFLASSSGNSDTFTATYCDQPVGFGVTTIPPFAAGNALYSVPSTPLAGAISAVFTATAGGSNTLSLTDGKVMRSCRVGLTITRNSQFNPVLLYQRARVESPQDVFPLNTFTQLSFDMSVHPNNDLHGAFTDFFTALLSDSVLAPPDKANLAVEVGTSLVWYKGPLEIVTPFSILASDVIAASFPSATQIAGQIATVCTLLLGAPTAAPPEADSASIRLRIKLTEAAAAASMPRTLLEITALDFALSSNQPAPEAELNSNQEMESTNEEWNGYQSALHRLRKLFEDGWHRLCDALLLREHR